MPSDAEYSSMETFLQVLKPIVEIKETLGGEKLVTISAVRPLLHKLLLKHLIDKPSDSSLAKKILMIDLKDRNSDIMSLINKVCFLDPRFKVLVFMADSDKSCTIALVKEEAQKQSNYSTSANTSTSTVNLSDDDDAPPSSKKA